MKRSTTFLHESASLVCEGQHTRVCGNGHAVVGSGGMGGWPTLSIKINFGWRRPFAFFAKAGDVQPSPLETKDPSKLISCLGI